MNTSTILNPELTSANKNLIFYNGRLVKLFLSTRYGNTVLAEIMEGDGKGKLTTVCLPEGFE